MATKKPSPAQIAARQAFAERARSGAFKKKGKKKNAASGDSSVKSPTRTSSDVRSPTRTATSTEAQTSGNVTVTGGAGRGATTRVSIHTAAPRAMKAAVGKRGNKKPPTPAQLRARAKFTKMAKDRAAAARKANGSRPIFRRRPSSPAAKKRASIAGAMWKGGKDGSRAFRAPGHLVGTRSKGFSRTGVSWATAFKSKRLPNPKKRGGDFEKKVYSVMGSQSPGHWGHFGQVEAWSKGEAKEKAKTIQDSWNRGSAPPIKKLDIWPAGEVTARVKRRGNPGVIRFTEAEARRYSGKIRGLPSTSSGGRSAGAGSRARKATPKKKRGVLAGLGKSIVRGLGTMANPRRAKGKARRAKNPLLRTVSPTTRGRRTPGHLETSYGKGRKAYKRAKSKGIKGYFSGGLDRSVMAGSRVARGVRAVKLPNPKKRATRMMGLDFGRRGSGNKPGRKIKLPNPSPSKVFTEFRGKDAVTKTTARAATGTPKVLAKLGGLRELHLKGRKIHFGNNASLAADGRKKLHVVGARFGRPNPPGEVDYGEIISVTYRADKPHIEAGTFDYIHKFGEDGGKRPHLIVDAEGYPRIEGGSYKISSDGIID